MLCPFAAIVPVIELLNPAKPRKRLTEKRAKPIKTRGLKNAADEVNFVFMDAVFVLRL